VKQISLEDWFLPNSAMQCAAPRDNLCGLKPSSASFETQQYANSEDYIDDEP